MAKEVLIDGNHLTLADLVAVSHERAKVGLAPAARKQVERARAVIDEILASGRIVYGVNTGFGKLADVQIKPDHVNELQLNLIRSHAAGVGPPFPVPVTRAIMLLRANVLAKGFSGVRLEVVERLLDLLNHEIHPQIPSKGSVGASGDLAPLAHLALVLIGEGSAMVADHVIEGGRALAEKRITPIVLQAKEGLALINGTQAMTGAGALAWSDAVRLARAADVVAAMSIEAMRGTDTAFDDRIVNARPHQGAVAVARNLRDLIHDSKIRESHRDCHKVQDHYSLRCTPQVHGTARDALTYAEQVLSTEINAATDNPLVFSNDHVLLSGGNFHGAPVSVALDSLAIAVAQLASISERRTALLTDSSESELPPFLTQDSGLHSGFMLAQVTAAALVSENKVLAHPASVDTIPTSANKEDHVSMGVTAAMKFAQIVENTRQVLAIEWLCAAQALDLLAPLKTSAALQKAHRALRASVPMLQSDRVLANDIATAAALLIAPKTFSDLESSLGHPL